MDWKSILGTVLTGAGTAIGGPLGGVAGTLLGSLVGNIGSGDSKLVEPHSGADPLQLDKRDSTNSVADMTQQGQNKISPELLKKILEMTGG